ncbi:hypothetical protein [Leptospira paudalimensis]|uniref:Yip1 domain-containing protein n=1 Tax=Leptospira paudalimensis TaxID=2950024 RepID=A0ABT3MCM3_9LEPT|nr:hypothetical protein [Leptospira paudalimensis]MCW7506138.1 hypothetical protein [Leptospira paudalimensis]
MIEKFKNTWDRGVYFFLYNFKLIFTKKQNTIHYNEAKDLFKFSLYSILCIQLVIMFITNFFNVVWFKLYEKQKLPIEILEPLKEISYTLYLLNQYPLNQLIIFLLISSYVLALVISYKLAGFVIGEDTLGWKISSVFAFISFLPWQVTMIIMNLTYSYNLTNQLEANHWIRQLFVSLNVYLLLISFLLSFYLVIRIGKLLTNISLRKRVLISMFPCIIFLLIVGYLTME